MLVQEKCPSFQAGIEIELENARRQNTCPECGQTFIPRHSINAGFGATKPSTSSVPGTAILAAVLVLLGLIAAIFVSWIVGMLIVVAAAVVYAISQIGGQKN